MPLVRVKTVTRDRTLREILLLPGTGEATHRGFCLSVFLRRRTWFSRKRPTAENLRISQLRELEVGFTAAIRHKVLMTSCSRTLSSEHSSYGHRRESSCDNPQENLKVRPVDAPSSRRGWGGPPVPLPAPPMTEC